MRGIRACAEDSWFDLQPSLSLCHVTTLGELMTHVSLSPIGIIWRRTKEAKCCKAAKVTEGHGGLESNDSQP